MAGPPSTFSERGLEPWKESGGLLEARDSGRLDIRLADQPAERDAVYRFRHRVLGDRAGRRLGYTSTNGRLLQQLDVGADLLAAFDESNEVYASVRLEEFESACSRRGFDLAASSDAGRPALPRASFSSCLMVDPNQGPHLTIRILASMVACAARRGYRWDYCAPSSEDQRLRGRLGYRVSEVLADSGGEGGLLELSLPAPRKVDARSAPVRTTRWQSIRRRVSGRP